jgi:hypothetical protein
MTQQGQPRAFFSILPDDIPFAFPVHGRLRIDHKRRRRRRPEVIAHPTSFTPRRVLQTRPAASAMAVRVRRRVPVPYVLGRRPNYVTSLLLARTLAPLNHRSANNQGAAGDDLHA